MIELLTTEHKEIILNLLDGVEKEIKIVSPYLSRPLASKLCSVVKNTGVKCTFVTRIYIQDFLDRANSIDAIEDMVNAGIDVYAVEGLHTKLYLFDDEDAILGSANFTTKGLTLNVELSVHFSAEESVLKLHDYFTELVAKASSGYVTTEMLQEAREAFQDAYNRRKNTYRHSLKRFGADIGLLKKSVKEDSELLKLETSSGKDEKDIVNAVLMEMANNEPDPYDHTIWLRFAGRGDNRRRNDEHEQLTEVSLNGHRIYVSAYHKRPSIREGDEFYLASVTSDSKGKNQPVIVGRGTFKGFHKNNKVPEEWLERYRWMEHYCWYCIIESCDILNAEVKKGIPLDEILAALGSDTYIASFGKNESISDLAKKHHQKAHLRLSGKAKDYIDKRLDALFEKYGYKHYSSDDED